MHSHKGALPHASSIDSTYVRAHRSAHGGKRGEGADHRSFAWRPDHQNPCRHGPAWPARNPASHARHVSDVTAATELLDQRPPAKTVIADKGYDADRLRSALRAKGARPVIPGRRNRKKRIRYDENRYRERWRIEAAFCRLKDFRRIATRYDRLAANFMSAVALVPLFVERES